MTPPTATTPAQLLDLALDVIALQFRLAAQARTLSGDEDAGGTFGVLRSLDAYGPTTVPDLARLRPVSRQRIQKLVDLLRARGFVETRPNPRHRRSPLIALTDAGRAHLAAARALSRGDGGAGAGVQRGRDRRSARHAREIARGAWTWRCTRRAAARRRAVKPSRRARSEFARAAVWPRRSASRPFIDGPPALA